MESITYLGHNTFLIESEVRILTDPFISENRLAASIDIDAIKVDFILLTHGHGDHVADMQRIVANNPSARVIGIVEVLAWFKTKGVQNMHELNFGGTKKLTSYSWVKLVQAVHTSSMPDGSYGGHPGSYILRLKDKTIFLAGDTALHSDLRLFGECYDFDLCILPIGGNYTMDSTDAALAAQFLGCQQVIGCHYDTFPVITIDKVKAVEAFRSKNLQLHLPEIGEKLKI